MPSMSVCAPVSAAWASRQSIIADACRADFCGWMGWAPVLRDVWGHGCNILRLVMWLFTTPVRAVLVAQSGKPCA